MRGAAEGVHKFGSLLSLLARVSSDVCVFGTMQDVIAQDFFRDTPEPSALCGTCLSRCLIVSLLG
jgi:hypothetical protein